MSAMRLFLTMAFAGLIAAAPALAKDKPAPSPRAVPAPATAPTPSCPRAQMDQHLQRMQAMHEAMAKARTPEERAKLMDAQRALMQQGMAMMRQMPGHRMGGGMGMRGGQGAAQGACMNERMAMMEMMMQMMMDRMAAEPPAK